MKRLAALLLLIITVPALLAPVRLQDATPAFALPLAAQSPAPEAYSLPPAAPLVTPTVIPVSPTILPEEPTVSPSLNMPRQVAPSQPQVIIQKVYVPVDTGMTLTRAALCQRAMVLVQDLAMLGYRQKQDKGLFNMALAGATGAGMATSRQWPDMNSFNRAASGLPWFYPNKAELTQAIGTARNLCGR